MARLRDARGGGGGDLEGVDENVPLAAGGTQGALL